NAAPHSLQNLASGEFSRPHAAQTFTLARLSQAKSDSQLVSRQITSVLELIASYPWVSSLPGAVPVASRPPAMRAAWRRVGGWPSTAVRKDALSSLYTVAGVCAVTV